MKEDVLKTQHSSEEDEAEIHRLRDIETNEVSLVDRGANKKRFLVIKKDGQMDEQELGTEVVSDDDGVLTAADADVPETDAPETDAPEADATSEVGKAGHTNGADDEDEEEKRRRLAAAKQDLTIPGPVKAAVTKTLTESMELLTSALDQVKAAKETDENSSSLPIELDSELKKISSMIASVSEKYPSPTAGKAANSVEKRGKRMAKERLGRLSNAVQMLQELVKELANERAAPKSVGKAAISKSEEVPKPDPPTQPANNPSPDESTLRAIKDLTQVVKSQGEQLSQLSKGVVASNAIPVDGSRSADNVQDDIIWPMDMNRPIDRDSVRKEHWFGDGY